MYLLKKIIKLILIVTIISSCIFKNGAKNVSQSGPLKMSNATISKVEVVNNQLVITGTNLSQVTRVKTEGENLSEIFNLESISATKIVANSIRGISFSSSGIFNLILSNAESAAVFPLSFSLADKSITASKLSSMGALRGQVLKYNGSAWVPTTLTNAQLYRGTYDAATGLAPDLLGTAASAGDYYIVTNAGNSFNVNDWIIFNGLTWDKISPATSVTGFNGRTGAVIPVADDYNLVGLSDVDHSMTPTADQVLTYDATSTKWIAKTPTVSSSSGIQSIVAGSGLSGGTITTTGTIAVDTGTTAGKILKLDASAKIPAVDGSLLTNIDPTHLSSAVTVAKGGTGLIAGTPGGIPYFIDANTMNSSGPLGANGIMIGQGAGFAPTTISSGTSGYVLTSGGAGAPTWTQILPVANGGTGQTSMTALTNALDTTALKSSLGLGSSAYLPFGTTLGSVPVIAFTGIVANQVCIGDTSGGGNFSCPSGGIYQLANGNVGIGTNTPSVSLDLGSKTDAIRLPNGATGAVASPIKGMIRYNTTSNAVEFYDNSAWRTFMSGSGTGTQTFLGDVIMAGANTGLAVTHNETVGGTLLVTGETTLTGGVTGATTFTGDVSLTGPTTGLDVTNNAIVHGTLAVTGASTLTGNTIVSGTLGVGGATTVTGTLGVTGATSFNDNITIAANKNFVMSAGTGSVGIGTAAPSSTLDVNGSFRSIASYGTYAGAQILTPGSYGQFEIVNISTNTDIPYLSFHSSGNTAWQQGIQGSNFVISQTSGATKSNNDSEKLTITGSGDVGIGITAPAYKLDVNGSANTNTLHGGDLNGSGNFHIDSTTIVPTGAIYLNWFGGSGGVHVGDGTSGGYGQISASAFNAASDRRLKKNIEKISNPLDIIDQINGVRFDWIKESPNNKRQVGVIAQDVQKVLPELVSLNKQNNYLTVNYSALVAPLIEAVKELYHKWFDDSKNIHREIASLKSENEVLKKENAEIKDRLIRIEKSLKIK